jgi:hypothetical protein
MYEETERWPFPGPAGIASIQTGLAEGGEAKTPLPWFLSHLSTTLLLLRITSFVVD